MKPLSWGPVLIIVLLTAACASGPAGPRGGLPGAFSGEDDVGPGAPRTQLFISPSGQPFRAPLGQPYPVAAWFAHADADHDGTLTRSEFRADADAWFNILDVDRDGRIDMPEVTRWEEELVPEITRISPGPGLGRGGRIRRSDVPSRNSLDTRRQGAALYSLINEPHPVRGADADLSMTVSREEWRAATDRRFGLLDADHDGAVTLAELRPTPLQAMTQAGREKTRSQVTRRR